MPYLEFVRCEKCGHGLDIDQGATIRAYYEEGRSDKDTFINPATIIWDYLVYTCYNCGVSEKYTFRDIEKKVREHFSSQSERFKDYFDQLDVIDVDEMARVTSQTLPKIHRRETVKRLNRLYTKK